MIHEYMQVDIIGYFEYHIELFTRRFFNAENYF